MRTEKCQINSFKEHFTLKVYYRLGNRLHLLSD